MILFKFYNQLLCRFASWFYGNIYCGNNTAIICWKSCEKCVKKRNHVKSMLVKIQVHQISISNASELFDMHVKLCNTCDKFLSYVWTFFPCILLHVKSFHTHETILSCMWTSNFTCIIDTMHVKNFTCMWTLFYACQSEHVNFFQGLLNATTMNHMFIKMPWISVEYPMKNISWPTKTAKLNFMPLFLAMNFLCKGNFLFNDSWNFFMTRDSWALNFPRKLGKGVFRGP